MLSLLAHLAPLALLVPLGAGEPAPEQAADERAQWLPRKAVEPGPAITGPVEKLPTDGLVPPLISYQVRIERRVTVRIAPRSPSERMSLMEELPEASQPTRYQERKIGKCVTIRDIAGVQTGSGNRLLLFLRDRRMITARLEKACRARDFYSGFYLERNDDGKLCVERDKLQSRAGANCQLTRIRELVPVED